MRPKISPLFPSPAVPAQGTCPDADTLPAKGPYAPAVLRFQFLFLDDYPVSPPLITFSTDIFHPLVNSLTTYTYTTSVTDGETGSAVEHETLPPGGFSLRHGFPHWFSRERGRSRSQGASSNAASRPSSLPEPSGSGPSLVDRSVGSASTSAAVAVAGLVAGAGPPAGPLCPDVPILALLEYIRAAFTDDALLDSIPLDAAANQGAYHAWRSYRAYDSAGDKASRQRAPSAVKSRRPGEWNWEGVWEERVRKGIRASLSEQVLFGGAVASDDLVCFSSAPFPFNCGLFHSPRIHLLALSSTWIPLSYHFLSFSLFSLSFSFAATAANLGTR